MAQLNDEINKFLNGGQDIKTFSKWFKANSSKEFDSGDTNTIKMISQVTNDLNDISERLTTEQSVRKSWRRMLDGMRFSKL